MKLNNSFEYIKIGEEMTAVPIGDNPFKGVILLNETMKEILELMGEEDFTIEMIEDKMMDRYCDITKEKLHDTISKICADLIEKGIIEK